MSYWTYIYTFIVIINYYALYYVEKNKIVNPHIKLENSRRRTKHTHKALKNNLIQKKKNKIPWRHQKKKEQKKCISSSFNQWSMRTRENIYIIHKRKLCTHLILQYFLKALCIRLHQTPFAIHAWMVGNMPIVFLYIKHRWCIWSSFIL